MRESQKIKCVWLAILFISILFFIVSKADNPAFQGMYFKSVFVEPVFQGFFYTSCIFCVSHYAYEIVCIAYQLAESIRMCFHRLFKPHIKYIMKEYV